MRKILDCITILFLFIIYVYIVNISNMPKQIVLFGNEKMELKKMWGVETVETSSTSSSNVNKTNVEVKLFGILNVKDITVTTLENYEVVPIGKIIGLKLYTNGVLIVGMSEIEDINNSLVKPFDNIDIKEGDTIIEVNGTEIDSIENLQEKVNNSKGENIDLTLIRDGIVVTANIKPAKTEENEYKLGLWVKDAATGVGTITFYEPESKSFAALGHGITDSDTDKLIDIDSGEIVTSKVIDIKKSEQGEAGEIKGSISGQSTIGKVSKNTEFGIYGSLNNLTSLNIDTSNRIDVALRNEIKTGEAIMRCTLDDGICKDYKIEIEKIYLDNNSNNKSMLIKIVDKNLIEKTGGIVRGLSGAPILQNGKFVGAVTNVLVNDPTRGYAVFAETMIKELMNE